MNEEILEEISEDFESDAYKIKLDNFEGPLDLLLHLVKKAKISIEEIFVSQITEQYLSYMEQLDELDMDKASDFIEIAATLLEIKSKSLLPKPEIELPPEEDPEKEFVRRLQEYKLYKEASEKMKAQETVGIHFRAPDPSVGKPRLILKDMTTEGLIKAMERLFIKVERQTVIHKSRKIVLEPFTVDEKILFITDILKNQDKVFFDALFEDDCTKLEIIITFLALLELLKLQQIRVLQPDVFDRILIERLSEE